MSNQNILWSTTPIIASELSVGSKLITDNGIILEKISEETWKYKTSFTNISYNNNSVDNFKLIESIDFIVETN